MLNVIDDLAQLPDDPAAVCELAKEFLLSWGVMTSDQLAKSHSSDLSAAENRLGFTLPIALRWLYAHVGADNTIIGYTDPLVSPQDLKIDENWVLLYRRENQNSAAWGVRMAQIDQQDPPVVWMDMRTPTAARTWAPYQTRLSVDILEMSLSEAMFAPRARTVHMENRGPGAPDMSSLVRLDISGHVFWARPEGPLVTWYGLADCIVRNDGDSWLWALGRTDEALGRLRKLVPGSWAELDV